MSRRSADTAPRTRDGRGVVVGMYLFVRDNDGPEAAWTGGTVSKINVAFEPPTISIDHDGQGVAPDTKSIVPIALASTLLATRDMSRVPRPSRPTPTQQPPMTTPRPPSMAPPP